MISSKTLKAFAIIMILVAIGLIITIIIHHGTSDDEKASSVAEYSKFPKGGYSDCTSDSGTCSSGYESNSTCSSRSHHRYKIHKKANIVNSDNFPGSTVTYGYRHAASSIGMVVIDTNATVSGMTRCTFFSLVGNNYIQRNTIDVDGINPSVCATRVGINVLTQNTGLDGGILYSFAPSSTAFSEITRSNFSILPLSFDSHDYTSVIRFANTVEIHKNGVKDYVFYDLATTDVKIHGKNVVLSAPGVVYLFDRTKYNNDAIRTFKETDASFGTCIDVNDKFITMQDSEKLYIYSLDYLQVPRHIVGLTTGVDYRHQLGDDTLVLWNKVSTRVFQNFWNKRDKSSEWKDIKLIETFGSQATYVSHNGDWITISRDIDGTTIPTVNVWQKWNNKHSHVNY